MACDQRTQQALPSTIAKSCTEDHISDCCAICTSIEAFSTFPTKVYHIMSPQPKLYVLLRNKDFPPGGPIRLGSLLTDAANPESLVEGYTPSIPLGTTIYHAWENNHRDTITKNHSTQLGLYTKFLQILGIGLDISGKHAHTDSTDHQAERLDKQYYIPSTAECSDILQDRSVQACVQKAKFSCNVYLVTGIRVATRGAQSEHTDSGEREFTTDLTFDATLGGGVPLSFGPSIAQSNGHSVQTSSSQSSPFVYAYRVKEIHWSKVRGTMTTKDVKGELYGLTYKGSNETTLPGTEDVTGLALDKLGDDSVTAGDLELEGKLVDGDLEGGHPVEFVLADALE